MKITLLENSKIRYSGADRNNFILRGAELAMINYAEELSKLRHKITLINNCKREITYKGVNYRNINNINEKIITDFAIANSDANLFKYVISKRNYILSHSIQSFEKFLRKKQLIPFIKYKPLMILEGDYHFKNRSFLTSFFGKKILKIATDYDFIKTDINIDFIPPPNAIFTTKSDRNLNFLIDAWFEIRKKNPDSNLYINPPHQLTKTQIENGIILRNKDKKDFLIKELINSKLFISPGHKTEVFCLAAEEAKELCVPIVTMGIGCLYERVEHEKTGFIAKTQKEFVNYSSLILNDNIVYKTLRQNLYNRRNSRNYSHVKKDLINILTNND